MQVWHGTVDQVLNYTNFGEEIKEWTAVLGLSETPTSTIANTPLTGWTKTVYGPGDRFEAYSAAGVDHNIPNQESVVMQWFDLTCTSGSCYSRPASSGGESTSTKIPALSSTTRTSSSAATTTISTGVEKWGQWYVSKN